MTPRITEAARAYREKLYPGSAATLYETDPEFVELFANFAFDEVVNAEGAGGDLDDRTRFLAILSALIFNAIIIPCLIPLAMKGVKYRPMSSGKMLGRNMMIYGLGGIIAPFVGIKIIDLIIAPVLAALGFGM